MTNSIEEPLERLNYFNGQRLEAEDFSLEQDYHIRVRRWLNRALYTSGIAAGLEVTKSESDAAMVKVSAGLALDDCGREIILYEDVELRAVGVKSASSDWVLGNFLAISYAEEEVSAVDGGCCPRSEGDVRAWGGPERIRATPVLEFVDSWPTAGSGKIVLAQVKLDSKCQVQEVLTSARQYVNAAETGHRSFALEGEKDIDADNAKRIYFHISGRPESVSLYLRGAEFTSLFYTECGEHEHRAGTLSARANGATSSHDHTIDLSSITIGEAGSHRHKITSDVSKDANDGGIELSNVSDEDVNLTGEDGDGKGGQVDMVVFENGLHHHEFEGEATTDSVDGEDAHEHDVAGATASFGIGRPARDSGALTYVSELQISYDGTDITAQVLAYINDTRGTTWTEIGDGSSGHGFVLHGTKQVRLDLLGVDLSDDEHYVELSVASGGGRILYSLYVE